MGASVLPATTKCWKVRSSSEMALKIAVLSAQFVKPKEAFSMLTP